ncbi:hypothetical protein [Streptomyces sp. MJP52]|uniref:hypothetical protein n=1 Tax=Streptomyces sp. MJP52 TaxID=2940555 RepID=UPI0024752A94|nr:hypothetical protein [Streptomyces sp. MJP52]MDH6224374.1 hypothetical protein [Streptomyces sp. MJP52]
MWRWVVRRLSRVLGRRGALLTLKGTIALVYGASLLVQPTIDRTGLQLALWLMPLDAWGWSWIAAGTCALVCAWIPARRDAPTRRDWPGFLAVWLVTAPWAMSYLAAWWPLGDHPRGWAIALIYASFGGVCLVAIGWDEQPAHRRTEPPHGN